MNSCLISFEVWIYCIWNLVKLIFIVYGLIYGCLTRKPKLQKQNKLKQKSDEMLFSWNNIKNILLTISFKHNISLFFFVQINSNANPIQSNTGFVFILIFYSFCAEILDQCIKQDAKFEQKKLFISLSFDWKLHIYLIEIDEMMLLERCQFNQFVFLTILITFQMFASYLILNHWLN